MEKETGTEKKAYVVKQAFDIEGVTQEVGAVISLTDEDAKKLLEEKKIEASA